MIEWTLGLLIPALVAGPLCEFRFSNEISLLTQKRLHSPSISFPGGGGKRLLERSGWLDTRDSGSGFVECGPSPDFSHHILS